MMHFIDQQIGSSADEKETERAILRGLWDSLVDLNRVVGELKARIVILEEELKREKD